SRVAADLGLEQGKAFGGERRGTVPATVTRLPNALVRGRLDGVQDELREERRILRAPRRTSSRHLAAPHEDVEFSVFRELARVWKPRDAHRAVCGLKDAAVRGSNLLDRPR